MNRSPCSAFLSDLKLRGKNIDSDTVKELRALVYVEYKMKTRIAEYSSGGQEEIIFGEVGQKCNNTA